MYQLYRDRPLLVLCMVLANIVLSGWCFYLDPVINNDGITYLMIAQMFLEGQWASAFDYYSWPFYSLFIAITAKLTLLDVETAAYLLNTLFATSLTLGFVCIVGELSENNRRIIIIAAVVVILFPSISKYRAFIIRDFGYLSCYLWSLYFIVRFCSTLNKKHLIGWLLFAVLSFLFRFEGIAFLLIAPYFLILFTATRMPHRRVILSSLSVGIIAVSISLLYWYINDKYNAMIEMAKLNGDDIQSVTDLFFANIEQRFGENANYVSVFLANLWDVAYELIRRMAIFYFVFAIYAYYAYLTLRDRLVRRIWLVFVVTNLVVLIGFSLYNNFLVSRYTMATALTLLLLAPFAIERYWAALTINKPRKITITKRAGLILVFTLLAFVSLEGLDVRTQKRHIKDAALWVKANAPADAKIFSNNRLAIYYSGLNPSDTLTELFSTHRMMTFVNNGSIRNYDYVAIEANMSNWMEDTLRQTLSFKFGRPTYIAQGEDNTAMYIFKIEKP